MRTKSWLALSHEIKHDNAFAVCLTVCQCQRHAITAKASGSIAPSEIFDVGLRRPFKCFKISAGFYQFGGYKCPRSVDVRTDSLPMSGAGKFLKRELRRPFWENQKREVA